MNDSERVRRITAAMCEIWAWATAASPDADEPISAEDAVEMIAEIAMDTLDECDCNFASPLGALERASSRGDSHSRRRESTSV